MKIRDPLDISADSFNAAERAESEAASKDTEESDILWLMSTERGRRLVNGIIARSSLHHSGFSTVAMSMAYQAGRKEEGLRWLSDTHRLCPELYLKMIQEDTHDRSNRDASSHDTQ
jgi:hypothetical protein